MFGEESMKKRPFYTETAYLLGLILLAIGTALMEKADFGMSMVVAPAYLIYRKLNSAFPFFSFGMAEYLFQFCLLCALALIRRRVKLAYLFSFATAVLYGLLLDGAMALTDFIASASIAERLCLDLAGMLLCAAGVSLLFHTYIPPEAYELFVKEIAPLVKLPLHRFKTVYDLISCAFAVLLSFAFFGFGVFEGVKAGTIVCALINGSLIGLFSRIYEQKLDFRDALPLRAFFGEKHA